MYPEPAKARRKAKRRQPDSPASTYHLMTVEQRENRRRLNLKFPSHCARCRKPMPIGALAYWHPDPGLVAHIDCGAAHLVGPHGNVRKSSGARKGGRGKSPAAVFGGFGRAGYGRFS